MRVCEVIPTNGGKEYECSLQQSCFFKIMLGNSLKYTLCLTKSWHVHISWIFVLQFVFTSGASKFSSSCLTVVCKFSCNLITTFYSLSNDLFKTTFFMHRKISVVYFQLLTTFADLIKLKSLQSILLVIHLYKRSSYPEDVTGAQERP